jgi:orotate phosphoribosyltransferase
MTVQPAARRDELAGDLRRIGYLVGDLRGESRGGTRTYFERDLALTRPGILSRCAELIEELVPSGIDRIAVGGQAALALATALSLRTSVALLFVDLDAAGDGEPRVHGDAFPGAKTAFVTDVLLSGETASSGLEALREHGLVPAVVIALLDRERGARALLESDGVPVRSLFTESDLMGS